MTKLFSPFNFDNIELSNRIVMAPLTRCRALEGGIPSKLSATYYEQRATAGLIITEATNISPNSCAYDRTPGIYTKEQIEGWKLITQKVHEKKGKIFLQLWHSGRVSSKGLLKGKTPLSPFEKEDDLDQLSILGLLSNGHFNYLKATPSKSMSIDEIKNTVHEYAIGSENAFLAGFDGIEIHAANGYLIQQFLASTVNKRTDEYGGSVNNRARFLKEVIEAILEKIPSHKVGIRLSPYALYNNAIDENPEEIYGFIAKMIDEYKLAYIHASDTNVLLGKYDMPKILKILKANFKGPIIGCGGLNPLDAEKWIDEGAFDLIAFGRAFIANPDLVQRIKQKGPFNAPKSQFFYIGGNEGYTDYPFLQ
jgi:N-ethylmaleimide reductase